MRIILRKVNFQTWSACLSNRQYWHWKQWCYWKCRPFKI